MAQESDNKQEAAFSNAFHDYNPFQILHNSLSSAINELSLVPKTVEMDVFIKTIVSFVGYTQSSMDQYEPNVAGGSPNQVENIRLAY